MPSSLQEVTFQSPGTLGLNTQNADNVQDQRYSLQADNCVIAKNGLLESRQGFSTKNTAGAATGTPNIDVIFSYIEADGTENIIATGGNKIWVFSGTSATDKTGALTVTNDNWQFQNYDGEVFGYNGVDAPIYWDGGAGNFVTLASHGGALGIVASHVHLSAYGRSWIIDPTTPSLLKYSDLLVPEDFTSGGSIDLDTVFVGSNDTIVALAAHNGYLIIFCEKQIIIYASADDVSNIVLSEVITTVGCVARDSVQNIGDDIFFLAKDGVRSLARTVLQDNMPMKDISANVRDDIIESIENETATNIRSTYNEKYGFYLLTFPTLSKTWVCDVRLSDQGIYRWTQWDLKTYSLATGSDNTLYAGHAGGWMTTYTGYNDIDTSDGVVDATYVVKYRSAWVDTGLIAIKAVWKKLIWLIASVGSGSVTALWNFDFSGSERSLAKGITGSQPPVYGTGVYGTATYATSSYPKERYSFPLTGTGTIVQVGMQSQVNGSKFAFNRADLLFKTGSKR